MSEVLRFLHGAGAGLVSWGLQISLWTLGIFVVVRCLDGLLAPFVLARWRALLYLAVPIRMLLPQDWATPLGLFPSASSGAGGGWIILELERGLTSPGLAPLAFPMGRGLEVTGGLSWQIVFFLLYIAGIGLLIALRWRLLAETENLVSGAWQVPIPELAGTLGQNLDIRVHPFAGPALVGALRPVLLLPERLLETLEPPNLAWLIRHESTHVRRRHPWIVLAMQGWLIACWPILPVWLTTRRLRTLIEMTCDETLLEGAPMKTRRSYGEALLAVATRSPRGRAGWLVLHAHLELRARLSALTRRPRLPVSVQQAGMVVTLVMLLLASGWNARNATAGTVAGSRSETSDPQPKQKDAGTELPGDKTIPEDARKFLLEFLVFEGKKGVIEPNSLSRHGASEDDAIITRLKATGAEVASAPRIVGIVDQKVKLVMGTKVDGAEHGVEFVLLVRQAGQGLAAEGALTVRAGDRSSKQEVAVPNLLDGDRLLVTVAGPEKNSEQEWFLFGRFQLVDDVTTSDEWQSTVKKQVTGTSGEE